MHIADLNDLIHIHIVMTANLRQLIGKGNVHAAECILNNLSHLCRFDVDHDNISATEGSIEFFHLLTDFQVIYTNDPVVMEQFVHHVTGDDTFVSMDKMNVLSNLEALLRHIWLHIPINAPRTDCGLNDDCTFGATFRASPMAAFTYGISTFLVNSSYGVWTDTMYVSAT